MALPHLLKYVYTHGTDEVVRRGKKIHTLGFVELVEYDDLFGSAVLRVKDDSYSTYYKVNIQRFKDPKDVSLRCSCPYNIGDICRHETAALFQLQEMIDRGQLQADGVKYDQRHTVAKMKTIEVKMLRMLSSPEIFEEAEKFLQTQKAKIELAENEVVKASVTLYGAPYSVIIRKNEERNFDTSCDYDDTEHLLCLPKVIVFLQLFTKHGANYFDSIRNWDKDKNKLLEAYGYSLNDDLKGKFEFAYKDGKPFLRVLDASIKRVAPLAAPTRPVIIPQQREKEPEVPVIVQEERTVPMQRLGVVFNFNKKSYPWFTIDAVIGEPNDKNDGFAGNAEKPDISRYLDTDKLPEDDRQTLTVVRKLQDAEINKYISRNSPFSGIWENIIHQEEDDLPAETKELMAEYLFPRLKKLCNEQAENSLFFLLPANKTFKTSNLQPLQVIKQEAKPHFHVKKASTDSGAQYTIHCRVNANGIEYDLGQNESNSPLFFLYNEQLHLWKNNEVIHLIDDFLPTGKMEVTENDWSKKLHEFLLPLAKEHQVDFDKSIVQEIKDGDPEVKLFLIEKGDYLVFQPSFSYKGYETRSRDRDEIVVPQGDKVLIVHRNREAENAFIAKLQGLHSNFIVSEETGSLALKGSDVLKNNWFFLFVDAMKEIKTPVFGFEALKNFRFNTAKPQTKIFISSNTDWFDAKVDIVFGDQRVTVAEVKRALANKQQFVQLNDGTLGILPDEWLKKYSLLFRVGEGTNNNLKLSRFHLSVVDELYEERDEEELVVQLEEKYKNLRQFNTIEEIEPPENLKAILRPYQLAGYQWLNYLTEIKWGGILADDMGLGKTVQALSFLDHYRTQHDGHVKALVVCPTTLIYNWENEIKKFTPKLTYRIHHGPARTRAKEEITDHDVTITTYGTLRSDIKLLMSVNFDYVILDESQAIKNPSSKVTKAACLLNAKHRLCMSGTPLQNNTFDIFAQMHFLNPGMLGTMEFFRQEFAIPIDKFGEQDRKEHLKKILYPFILRRTKEQVAKDLPEKLEMILWCEMEDEQRKIYDAYRNEFRDKILGTIQEQGIQRSQLTILQGLMKLRQICDSPAILNEEEKFENHSIKLDELTREITENISNHKALVFSQFLGMLALIRAKLDELGVKYEYFDGSTSAPDREKAIQSFQNDDSVRVFLISLKAGGVGLNLTAADYVYIVDPWWNPAVEQQAIDRTHRIGQTKNIFAYRMICKDTIEDKILQLQDKKRALAKELIADDSSFVKSLSREDVEYLFS